MPRKKIEWKLQLIELLVIFIGISLAFFSENLRESYKEKQLGKKFLQSFHNELLEDRVVLERTIEINSRKINRADNFIQKIMTDEVVMDTLFLVISNIAQTNHSSTQTVTYESIINSGNLDLITDFNLKEKIIKYYLFLETKKDQDKVYNEFLKDYMMPFVLNKMDLINQKLLDDNIYKEMSFRNMVISYRTLLNQELNNDRIMLEMNEDLIVLFEATK
ncbi:hypothetical protein ACFLYK_00295 [Candidatus Cloacimonadota bacterium]